jgi:shikimate dehydrogenase
MDRLSISPRTQVCAVIGNPIEHSLSPAIHNAAFGALGLDFVYLAFRVEDVPAVMAGMRALPNFRGMSVTIPHKIAVMAHMDAIDPVDRAIGSINTVVRDGDRLVGFGTDGPGALKALSDAGVSLDGKTVLMLGAGGAARAIAFTLAWKTPLKTLAMLDINAPMLDGLVHDLRAGTRAEIAPAVLTPDTLAAAMAQADVVIHCTPIGMHPKVDATLVPAELFRPGQVVFDIVYTPLETRLLREAQAQGCTTIPGVEMFLNQAVLQFERFAGAPAPVETMRTVLLERLTS